MGSRLLLVDDSPMMRMMIGTQLQQEGYEVETACDGQEGLQKAREHPPELIVTDFEMPVLDGPGLCKELKADRELRGVPVVMLTSLGATESKVHGLDSGADDYVEKPKAPTDIQEVFARIRAQLRIATLRRELAEQNRRLEAAQAQMDIELRLARKVQMGLMPRPPRPRGTLRIEVYYQPANQLGGDVYEFAALDDGRIGLIAADISGHGVNAALLSGVVKALASPLLASGAPPSRVLADLDGAVAQYFPDEYFLTAFALTIDEATGAFEYAGIGHPPALVVGPSGTTPLDSEPGLLGLGMADGLTDRTGQLAPGESLLVYTDGLPDAMDPGDRPFGTERISSTLEAHRGDEPAAILKAIDEAVGRHVTPGHPHDDINMILIQNRGPAPV